MEHLQLMQRPETTYIRLKAPWGSFLDLGATSWVLVAVAIKITVSWFLTQCYLYKIFRPWERRH